jgi:hypothetical protein
VILADVSEVHRFWLALESVNSPAIAIDNRKTERAGRDRNQRRDLTRVLAQAGIRVLVPALARAAKKAPHPYN